MDLRLSLGHRMELTQTQILSQRLEQRLEQKLGQQLVLEMSLEQYLGYESLIQTLINHADEHSTWKKFDKDGFSFSYAEVPYRLAKPIAERYGAGFAHCLYNPFEGHVRGTWTLFVVPEMIPSNCIELVALHERGEELSLGNHYFATQLEFSYAQHTKKLKSHIDWLDKKFPSKFVDLTQKVHFPILPEEFLEDLQQQGKRNTLELTNAEKLIAMYPLPVSLLKKMADYDRATETVCKRLHIYLGLTQKELMDYHSESHSVTPEGSANIVNGAMRRALDIEPRIARVVSHARIEEWYDSFVKNVNSVAFQPIQRHLLMPSTFLEAYRLRNNNERLVSVMYKPEDKKRN